jgi:2-keto-4-pentenoate hydratase/2-oxohepta-3-ene-1,7-dioic acid hydratase in catechol pathway
LVKHYLLVKPRLFLTFSFNDFELETAFMTDANVGEMIPINEAEDYIFGMVLLNDWSAETFKNGNMCFGPFLAKVLHHQYHLGCYYGCIGAF